MWKLQTPSSNVISWYKKTMLDGLYSRIKKSTGNIVLSARIQNILVPKAADGSDDKSRLEFLLIAKPQQAHKLCNSLMKKIISGYDENEFKDYLKVKNKKRDMLYKKYHNTLKELLDVFDYDGQLSKNKSRSYKLTMKQGHNTCTYCNRQYVITINGKNNAQRIVRPQLDHWFSKELYPLLSLIYTI